MFYFLSLFKILSYPAKHLELTSLSFFLTESITIGRWMEAKILKLRRNRKKEIFGFLTFWLGRIFPEKSVLTEKKWKKFLPPTHAVLRSIVGRPISALERGIAERLGAFLLFQSLKEKLKSRFPEFFGKFRASRKFEFLISFWDFSIRDRKFPNRGPRRGSNRFGWKPG